LTARSFDIVINGGGLVGLAFALLLDRGLARGGPPLSIAVLDRQAPVVPDETGLRVSALSPASCRVFECCGAWSRLPAERIGVYRRMRVWHGDDGPDGSHAICFDAAEQGLPELGFIAENDLLRAVLWAAADESPRITLLAGVTATGLEPGPDAVGIDLAGGGRVRTRLLVGADGAESWVRRQAGIEVDARDCGQRAIVVHVASEQPHGNTAWQRFLDSGPVALLPLADGRSSVVWSLCDDRAGTLLAAADDTFGAELTAATGDVLGALTPTTARAAFPLSMFHAPNYVGPRWALIGDAAHRVHPLAGQGVNLGLLDAAVLADCLAAAAMSRWSDPGDRRALRRYERRRKGDNLLTLGLMDGLHRLFTDRRPFVAGVAGLGMGLIGRSALLRHRLAAHATGGDSDTRPAARGG